MQITNLKNAADLASALALGSAAAETAPKNTLPAVTDAVSGGAAKSVDHVCLSDECREHSAKLAAQAKHALALKSEIAAKESLALAIEAKSSRAASAPAAQDVLGVNADSAPPARDVANSTPAPTAPDRSVSQDDLNGLLAAYGAVSGDTRFDARFDFNNNGRIDFEDLNTALSSFTATPPATVPQSFTLEDVTSLLSTYGRQTGEQGFDARFDTNNDGVVDFTDLNHVLSNLASPVSSNHQQQLEGLIQSYGAGVGDPLYNVEFDFDNDGRISFQDLNELLSRIEGENR